MSFTYKGLTAQYDRHIVTDEEIDRQLERLRQQNPRIAQVTDRPTESGDEIVLDYAGFCDGVQFPGGTAQDQTLVLGSGTFIPGFEEQLLDKVPGEAVTVHVTFPEQYHSADLAGKAAEVRCTVKAIRVKTEYAMDDNFAREVGGCENLEQMRKKMGESLQAYADDRGEMDLQDRLMRMAADTMDFEPTEEQINAELDQQLQNMEAQLAQQGLSLKLYCQFMNTTEEQLRADARAGAISSVKVQAAIELIVELEGLDVTKEEIGHAVALIARQNNMTTEQLKPFYDAEFEAAVIRSVLTTKAMELVRASAQITTSE